MRIEDIKEVPKQGFLYVQCIWPEGRGEKDDCRAGTGIVWAGHGDVQQFPAALWPKLAPFPDVWRLLDAEGAALALEEAAERARQAQLARAVAGAAATSLTLSAAATNAQAVKTEPDAAALAAQAAAEAKDAGKQTGTDVVSVTATVLDSEQLAAMPDEDVRAQAELRGYELHPRLSPTNLRLRFLEAQAAQAAEQSPDGSATD